MKILHVPFGFYPDPIGGTEVYVESLAKHLQQLGTDVVIAVPSHENAAFSHETLPVRRFAVTRDTRDLRVIYGGNDSVAEKSFTALIGDEKPDVIHLHCATSAISPPALQAAKRRNIHIVLTYHAPSFTCVRGTLMRWGSEVCDGKLDLGRCTSCTLQGHGLNRYLSTIMSQTPSSLANLLGSYGRAGGLWTALQMHELVQSRHEFIRELFDIADRIVVLSDWIQNLLLLNAISADKMVVSRHGLPEHIIIHSGSFDSAPYSPLRLVYMGRIDPNKGIDIVINAIRSLSEAAVQLDVYGISQSGSETYYERLIKLAADDTRIRFCSPIPNHQVVETMRRYHIAVVPSQWLETGPLVVLEAYAAGIPVLGSDLGGMRELVHDNHDGLLIKPGSVSAWRNAILALMNDPALWVRLKKGINAPRLMNDVAQEMLALYESL